MAKKEKSKVSQRWRGLLILFVARLARILRPFQGRMLLWTFCVPYERAQPRLQDAELLSEAEHFRLELGGNTIGGWTIGNEKKRVLLMHGWCGDSSQLAPWVSGLRARGFSVIGIDAPAHGSSPGLRVSMDMVVDSLLAADEKFGPFAGAIAHSFGGLLISRALQRGLRADRVTFVAPPSGASFYFKRMLKFLRIPEKRWPIIDVTAEKAFEIPLTEYDVTAWRDLKVPIFVVHDRDDKEVPFSCHEQWIEAAPHAETSISEGLGHRRILADPNIIEEGIAFLDSSPRAATASRKSATT